MKLLRFLLPFALFIKRNDNKWSFNFQIGYKFHRFEHIPVIFRCGVSANKNVINILTE